jgi:mono/diheme cytochrome c family protein
MPGFARDAGGPLTPAQIGALVAGMRSRWARPQDGSAPLPPHAAPPGDAVAGARAYSTYCAACHGDGGRGDARGGSVVDAAYLALVSDQALRTAVIAGRPRLGMPDWRGYVPGRPMSDADIADVVAWLAAQRSVR